MKKYFKFENREIKEAKKTLQDFIDVYCRGKTYIPDRPYINQRFMKELLIIVPPALLLFSSCIIMFKYSFDFQQQAQEYSQSIFPECYKINTRNQTTTIPCTSLQGDFSCNDPQKIDALSELCQSSKWLFIGAIPVIIALGGILLGYGLCSVDKNTSILLESPLLLCSNKKLTNEAMQKYIGDLYNMILIFGKEFQIKSAKGDFIWHEKLPKEIISLIAKFVLAENHPHRIYTNNFYLENFVKPFITITYNNNFSFYKHFQAKQIELNTIENGKEEVKETSPLISHPNTKTKNYTSMEMV